MDLKGRGEGVIQIEMAWFLLTFSNRLEGDVVEIAEEEANGIRGCTLHIEYTSGEELVKTGKIKCNPHLPSS